MNWVMGQRVLPLLNFQYWSYDYFFSTKNRYSWMNHANLAIWWWRSSKVSSRSVFVFACHVIILTTTPEFFFATLVIIIKKLTDDLLTLSHSISLSTDPSLANHNPAISFVPPGTNNLNKSLQADKKPW